MPIPMTAAPDNAAHLELDLADIGQLVAVDAAWPLHAGCLRPGPRPPLSNGLAARQRTPILPLRFSCRKAHLATPKRRGWQPHCQTISA